MVNNGSGGDTSLGRVFIPLGRAYVVRVTFDTCFALGNILLFRSAERVLPKRIYCSEQWIGVLSGEGIRGLGKDIERHATDQKERKHNKSGAIAGV